MSPKAYIVHLDPTLTQSQNVSETLLICHFKIIMEEFKKISLRRKFGSLGANAEKDLDTHNAAQIALNSNLAMRESTDTEFFPHGAVIPGKVAPVQFLTILQYFQGLELMRTSTPRKYATDWV